MRALVKSRPEPGLWMERVPVPEPGPTDVLIRVTRSAICGTDVHIWNWDDWAARTVPVPMVVGHEFCGEIAGIGPAVRRFSVGQRVSGEGHIVCGACRNCRAGRGHLCRNTRAVNADHTALSFDLVGEDVLVTGAGPIGIMGALVARRAGARKVVITDINPYRLALARTLGVEHVVDAGAANLAEVMGDIGMTEGFDIGLEMSGAAPALRDMIDKMNNGGRIAILGIAPAGFEIDWNQVIFKMLTLKGIYGREMFETWYKMIAFVQSGLDLAPLITHRIPIDAFAEGFEVMRSGRAGKVVMDWS